MSRPRTISDEQLLEAARDVFLEHGPGASVGLIAQRLGVSHAALFQRVGSKEQLLLRSLLPERARLAQVLAGPAPAPSDPQDCALALREALATLMSFLRRALPGIVVLRCSGHAPGHAPKHAQERAPGQASEPPHTPEAMPALLRRQLQGWLLQASQALRPGALDEERAWALAEGLLGAMEARCFNDYLSGATHEPWQDDPQERDRAFLDALIQGLVPWRQTPGGREG